MPSPMHDTTLSWCRDPDVAEAAAALFVAEAVAAYISHGELQGGRAVARTTWAPDLRERVEASVCIAAACEPDRSGPRLATMIDASGLVGFALVAFAFEATRPYAVLEDMIVARTARGRGLGTVFLDWLAGECRARGLARIFLESGLANTRAHAFFERHGFDTVSVVKMREL